MNNDPEKKNKRPPLFKYENGRFYFTARAERQVLFILTLVLLIAGACYMFAGL